ncbi:MAG TPA: extracellular solute-binding protein [Ktedonobacterales bacterium]|nr:extracellular solute-binding protein [Ktedonobacterales bacterium]
MPTRTLGATPLSAPLSRRALVRNGVGAWVGIMGIGSVLAACGPSSSNGTLTLVTNDLPPTSDPGDTRILQNIVTAFQQQHSGVKVHPILDQYDPTTYFSKAAAHTQEDAVDAAFTEPPLMIQRGTVADVTSQIKKQSFYSSFIPSALAIATGPNGALYGLPYAGYELGIMYSKKLVKKAGLDPAKPPATWADFRAYAKQIAASGTPGFIELTSGNTGGWHLTNWIYTAGGDLETVSGGKTTAVFNNDKAVAWLTQLQAMKHVDKSMTSDVLVGYNDALQAIATGKAAMVVEAPDTLVTLKSSYQADMTDLAMWPMPQNGGNAALTGGHIYVFKVGDSADLLQAAVDWCGYYRFDLGVVENYTANQAAAGLPVGGPANILFTGDYQTQRTAITNKYANLPQDNYTLFSEAKLNLRPEPPTQTQKMYATLDPVVQAVLSDPHADPKSLLDAAAQQFQSVLDAG